MRCRLFMILVVLASATCICADKKLCVTNQDTGESLEVSVADGLNIYSIKEDWLDSIPYLQEHARLQERWAYNALGDCFRYGIGVEKNFINAMMFYSSAGRDFNHMAAKAYAENPNDEFGLFYFLINSLDKNIMSDGEVLDIITKKGAPLPRILQILKNLLSSSDIASDPIKAISLLNKTSNADECFTVFSYLMSKLPDSDSIGDIIKDNVEAMDAFLYMADSVPHFSNIAGLNMFMKSFSDSEKCTEYEQKALAYFYKAYSFGVLDPQFIIIVISLHESVDSEKDSPFTFDEIERLKISM